MMAVRLLSLICFVVLAGNCKAQDVVRYRTRTAKGEWPIQEAKGTIESESLVGVKIGGNVISVRDIVEVEYETPGAIRLDVREARQAEDDRKKVDDAIRRYRALVVSPTSANNANLKRHFETKVALLVATRAAAGRPEEQAAIETLIKFNHDYPNAWQRVGLTRQLARLYLDMNPTNYEAARRVYTELGSAAECPATVKADCHFAIVDLHLAQGDVAKAKDALKAVGTDPRSAAYRIACNGDPANTDAAIQHLEALIATSDDSVKPTIYNLLGDCLRRDPKKEKEALFAYLKVDLIYNHDPAETLKAQDRIAELFKKMGQDERAKTYYDRARGRG